jgi:hypothetical protein
MDFGGKGWGGDYFIHLAGAIILSIYLKFKKCVYLMAPMLFPLMHPFPNGTFETAPGFPIFLEMI